VGAKSMVFAPARVSGCALLGRLHRRRIDEAAGLAPPQRRIVAILRKQIAMRALLDDTAPVEHNEAIHLRDGREAMRDRDHRLVSHERTQARLNGGFDFAVERRGRFVEYQDRRVLENDAGDGDALALAAGKLHAALADLRTIAAAAAPILKFKNK